MTRTSRTLASSCLSLATAALMIGMAVPAQAHGIIDLGGTDAVAGRTSTMTLEIQHGCITRSTGTIQVQAFVGRPWGRLVPRPVEGWTVQERRLASGGRVVTWTKQGDPQPFGTPVYFPIRVTWPSKPGTYSMKVVQACPDDVTTWGTPGGPATADAPSPPITPIPQVQVLPAD
jgi:uncharacterized protein YcnI